MVGYILISVAGPAKSWLRFRLDPYGDFGAWRPTVKHIRDLWNDLFFIDGYGVGSPPGSRVLFCSPHLW
jgi:hypothetical protein